MKCPRCGGSLVLSPDSTATIKFYDCPSCPWHFVQEPGQGLHDRWLSPLSIALYSQIFQKHPDQTAEANAKALLSQRPDMIAAILDEIDREIESPTQRVSEIHDFKYADEDSLRIHLKLLSVALRRILWERSGTYHEGKRQL
jgi:hypothetical protein